MKLILLGAPGAGKGTQAANLSRRLSIPTISTGQLLRDAIAGDTMLGREAKRFTDNGLLVPDEVIINMVNERIHQPDCQNGFILDGFPRTLVQAEELDKAIDIDAVLSLEISDEEIERRMTGRRICNNCGATYHLEYNRPRVANMCDVCGDTLVRRVDDEPETVRIRLKTYHENTEPLKGYYARAGKLRSVISQETVELTSAHSMEALGL